MMGTKATATRAVSASEKGGAFPPGVSGVTAVPLLSDTMYLLMSFRKSTTPQHRQHNILIDISIQ